MFTFCAGFVFIMSSLLLAFMIFYPTYSATMRWASSFAYMLFTGVIAYTALLSDSSFAWIANLYATGCVICFLGSFMTLFYQLMMLCLNWLTPKSDRI